MSTSGSGADVIGIVVVGLLSSVVSAVLIALAFLAIYICRRPAGAHDWLGYLSRPGEFDDEETFLRDEADALETMDDLQRADYLRAKAFIAANPPESLPTDISLSQYMAIQEKGVSAWEFEPELEIANCFVEARTEIEFYDSVCTVMSNLPVPKQNEVYYWEAKIYDKPASTLLSIGMATKPYPLFRLPGLHKSSVAYLSDGTRRYNQPFRSVAYAPEYVRGDVVGVGYRPRSGTIFFTRNGRKYDDVACGLKSQNFFPAIGATGPATVHVNLGQSGFVFIEANVKKWGLAPVTGSLAPPPPYGAEQDSILLESSRKDGESSSGPCSGPSYQPSQPSQPYYFTPPQQAIHDDPNQPNQPQNHHQPQNQPQNHPHQPQNHPSFQGHRPSLSHSGISSTGFTYQPTHSFHAAHALGHSPSHSRDRPPRDTPSRHSHSRKPSYARHGHSRSRSGNYRSLPPTSPGPQREPNDISLMQFVADEETDSEGDAETDSPNNSSTTDLVGHAAGVGHAGVGSTVDATTDPVEEDGRRSTSPPPASNANVPGGHGQGTVEALEFQQVLQLGLQDALNPPPEYTSPTGSRRSSSPQKAHSPSTTQGEGVRHDGRPNSGGRSPQTDGGSARRARNRRRRNRRNRRRSDHADDGQSPDHTSTVDGDGDGDGDGDDDDGLSSPSTLLSPPIPSYTDAVREMPRRYAPTELPTPVEDVANGGHRDE